jgi:hypothetical protein
VAILFTSDEQQRRADVTHALDGRDQIGVDAKAELDLEEEERSKDLGEGEPNRDTVDHGLSKGRIDGLENESLDLERSRAEKRCGTPLRNAEVAEGLCREPRAEKRHRGSGVLRFEIAKRDLLAGALAMGLRIEEKHRISCLAKKNRASYHLTATRTHGMRQNDRPAPRHPAAEPGPEQAARVAGEPDRFCT